MGEYGRGFSQRLIDQDLLVRVREVILSADDVRDTHQYVINNDREVVEGMPVGTQQNQVFDFVTVAFLQTIDGVVEGGFPFIWNFEANDKWIAAPCALIRFLPRKVTEWIQYFPL